MAYRILHCGDSLDNYYICLEKGLAGFTNKSPGTSDTVFVALKYKGESVCGAKGTLGSISEQRPWKDSHRFARVFTMENLEFCTPFSLKVLEGSGGAYWALRFVLGAKVIGDIGAQTALDTAFSANKIASIFKFQ